MSAIKIDNRGTDQNIEGLIKQSCDSGLFQNLNSAGAEQWDKVANAVTGMVRLRVTEGTVATGIMNFKDLQNGDLYQQVHTEEPSVLAEAENAVPYGSKLNWDQPVNRTSYEGKKYVITFKTISTPEFFKNVNMLRTYRNDFESIVKDRSIKQLAYNFDDDWFSTTYESVGAVPNVSNPNAFGEVTYIQYEDAIRRATYVDMTTTLTNSHLPTGCLVANVNTWNQFRKWGRDEAGGDLSELVLTSGEDGIKKILGGITNISTLKQDLVPTGTFLMYPTEDYLGKGYIYNAPTTYIKRDEDIVSFKTKMSFGFGFPDSARIRRIDFLGSAKFGGAPTDGNPIPAYA